MPLNGCGDGVFTGEPTGMVEAHGGVSRQFHRETDSLLLEGVAPLRPIQAQQPEHRASQGQRNGKQRTDTRFPDRSGACGVGRRPRCLVVQGDDAGLESGQRLRVRGRVRQAAHIADRVGLNLLFTAAVTESGTTERNVSAERPRRRILAVHDSLHDFHHRHVGEARHQCIDQILAGGGQIEGPSHTLSCRIDDARTSGRLLTLSDIEHQRRDPLDGPLPILQAEHRDAGRTPRLGGIPGVEARRTVRTAVQYPAQDALHVVRGGVVVHIAEAASDDLLRAMVSADGADVVTAAGTGLRVDLAAGQVQDTSDVVVIPGGPEWPSLIKDDVLLDAVRVLDSRSRCTASICTGAFLLAASGLLDGRKATTHWRFADQLALRYPQVTVEADGHIMTSAGVSSGIDLSLALVEEHLGADVARAVAKDMVVFMQRPGGQSQFSVRTHSPRARPEMLRRVLDAVAEDPCGKVWEEQVPAAGHRRSNGTRLFTPISCATTRDVHMNPAARDRLDTVTS